MKNYTPDKPAFSDNISITTEGDLVDADNDSAAVKQLLGNTLINAQNIAAEESRACQKESDIENNLDYEIQEIRRLIDLIYANANGYTDNKIAQLVNGAPSTLDTLGEIAKSMQENDTVVNALEKAIGSKANAAEFDSHEIDNIKHITASERAKWNAKQETTGDAKDNTVTFTSDDAKNPAAWTSMVLFKSQEKLSSLFNKVSIMAKNVRYLYKMLGSTDISGIGDGTVTGVLSQLNSKLTPQPFNITLNPDHCSKSYSVCYRIGNIAVLSLYLDIKNIVINSRTLIAALPFKIKNTSICTIMSLSGKKVGLRLENIDNTGALIIDPPYNTAIESDTILQQYVAIIE